MKRCFHLIVLLFSFSACNDGVKSKTSEPETAKEKSVEGVANNKSIQSSQKGNIHNEERTTNSDADILHNITLFESGGLTVAQAYLTTEDGNLLSKTNEASLGEAVYLNLLIEKGWEIRDGLVSIDATEIIATDEGQMVLNAPNLFKTTPTITSADAKRIVLKATITKTRPDIDHFLVNYRVWDKWSDAEVKGSYLLYINKEGRETE